jgi:hypothetical protein
MRVGPRLCCVLVYIGVRIFPQTWLCSVVNGADRVGSGGVESSSASSALCWRVWRDVYAHFFRVVVAADLILTLTSCAGLPWGIWAVKTRDTICGCGCDTGRRRTRWHAPDNDSGIREIGCLPAPVGTLVLCEGGGSSHTVLCQDDLLTLARHSRGGRGHGGSHALNVSGRGLIVSSKDFYEQKLLGVPVAAAAPARWKQP